MHKSCNISLLAFSWCLTVVACGGISPSTDPAIEAASEVEASGARDAGDSIQTERILIMPAMFLDGWGIYQTSQFHKNMADVV